MKRCPQCQFQTDKNDEMFCGKCGTKLELVPEKPVCKRCGAELKPDLIFCTKCGMKIEAAPKKAVCKECGAELTQDEVFCGKCGARNGASDSGFTELAAELRSLFEDDQSQRISGDINEDVLTISLSGEVKLEMVKVKAGSFEMSAWDGENRSGEVPHQATLTRDFFIGRTVVTQAQWQAVTGNNPSGLKGDDLPVGMVSWNDAMEFCEKMNKSGKAPNGWMFTLPTETQWEYAARGGNRSKGYKYSGSNDIHEVAWYLGNSGRVTHPVGQKKANELGLYDMSGNTDEWVLDEWENRSDKLQAEFTRGNDRGGLRVRRGGSWNASAYNCRPADRGNNSPNNPSDRFDGLSVRLALVRAGEDQEAQQMN